MFTKRYRPSISLIGGAAIALLAVTGFSQEANAQQPIRSNIAPRPVRSNLVPTTNIRSNLLAPSVQEQLSAIAEDLNTTVDALLESQQIAEIALSPAGADVLSALQQAEGITETSEGNFEVAEDGNVTLNRVESPQAASVEAVINTLNEEE